MIKKESVNLLTLLTDKLEVNEILKKEVSALTDYRAERAKQPTKSYDFPDTLAIEKDKDDKRLSKEDRHTDDSSEVTTKQEHPITFEDLNKIRLKRDHLEKWVHKPIFEKIVPNFFVRIGIVTKDNQRVYRVAEIIEVKDSTKKYLLGKTETTKQLVLKHGSSQKPFRMEFISNQDFTKEEYNRWEHEMSKISDPLPTLKEVAAKLESLKEIEEYTLTEADIDKVVVNKIKMRNKPINLAKEKTSLITLREAARQNDDEEEVNKLNEKIAEIDEIAREQEENLQLVDDDKKKKPNVADINKKNKNANLEAKTTVITSENEASNPFSRRPTAPIILWKTGEANKNQETKKEESPKLSENLKNSIEFLKLSKESLGEDDLDLDDLDIDVDLEAVLAKPVDNFQYLLVNLLKPVVVPKQRIPSRTLSVEEYTRRMKKSAGARLN